MRKWQKLTLVIVYGVFFTLLAGIVWGMDVTLQWDATSQSDVTKAKVFYKQGLPGEPWDGTGAAGGDSPILMDLTTQDENADPNIIEFTVNGLPNVDTSFTVKAVDNYGRESDYSNSVTATAGNPDPFENLRIKDIK